MSGPPATVSNLYMDHLAYPPAVVFGKAPWGEATKISWSRPFARRIFRSNWKGGWCWKVLLRKQMGLFENGSLTSLIPPYSPKWPSDNRKIWKMMRMILGSTGTWPSGKCYIGKGRATTQPRTLKIHHWSVSAWNYEHLKPPRLAWNVFRDAPRIHGDEPSALFRSPWRSSSPPRSCSRTRVILVAFFGAIWMLSQRHRHWFWPKDMVHQNDVWISINSALKKISHVYSIEDLENWGCNGAVGPWWCFDGDVFWE